MKNKKVENIITAILAAAVLITGGMSLYSYLSEQKAKNEYDTIRQEAVVEESRVEETERSTGEKTTPICRLILQISRRPIRIPMALFSGAGYQLSGGTGRGQQLLSEAFF